ncbi:hypothetical protein BKA80DRAFT_261291 [Phyllosticta citrichinensis]
MLLIPANRQYSQLAPSSGEVTKSLRDITTTTLHIVLPQTPHKAPIARPNENHHANLQKHHTLATVQRSRHGTTHRIPSTRRLARKARRRTPPQRRRLRAGHAQAHVLDRVPHQAPHPGRRALLCLQAVHGRATGGHVGSRRGRRMERQGHVRAV